MTINNSSSQRFFIIVIKLVFGLESQKKDLALCNCFQKHLKGNYRLCYVLSVLFFILFEIKVFLTEVILNTACETA